MSNTRRAEPGKPLRQERWMSSEEFERGLLGNLVARRCQVLDEAKDREIVYFLQQLSHAEGGLEKLSADLISRFPDRLGTNAMRKFGMKPGQVFDPERVRVIERDVFDPDFNPEV